jgi:GT2 family glycosyltransferase
MSPAVMDAPGPVRVALVDVDAPQDLDCSNHERAWILAVDRGRPLGAVELEAPGPVLAAEAVAEALAPLRNAAGDGRREGLADADVVAPLPRATVVVPTTADRHELLDTSIRALTRMDHPDFEIVVVDNRRANGANATLEALALLPGVRVVAERRPGISAARNAGLNAATGEIVAFTDDDVEVDPGWLSAIARRFVREPQLDVVTGMVVPKELETPAQVWFERSGNGLDRCYDPLTFALHPTSRFSLVRDAGRSAQQRVHSLYATGELGLGSNMAFRTETLRAAGGFDLALGAGTPTRGGEDLAILLELLRAGRRIGTEPAAIVHHVHRRGLDELERQLHGYGLGLTAMLTAIIWRDPRHVVGLLSVVPAALRSMSTSSSGKRSGQAAGYPPELVRAELRGMVAGPLAYLKSRRAQRRWRPADTTPSANGGIA